jgi:hypothetical protein
MGVAYRKHLILPTIDRDEDTGSWKATAHVQFTDKLAFNNFILRASTQFPRKKQAEIHIVHEVKLWIDERLRSKSPK